MVNMPANLENLTVATGLEKVSFHSNPKEGQWQRLLNYHTIALISHASKVMFKILQARLQQHMNCEIPDIQAGFRKGRRCFSACSTKLGYFWPFAIFPRTSSNRLFCTGLPNNEDLFLYSSSVYSCQLFLISSASVRSTPFLSFIKPIFA